MIVFLPHISIRQSYMLKAEYYMQYAIGVLWQDQVLTEEDMMYLKLKGI